MPYDEKWPCNEAEVEEMQSNPEETDIDWEWCLPDGTPDWEAIETHNQEMRDAELAFAEMTLSYYGKG